MYKFLFFVPFSLFAAYVGNPGSPAALNMGLFNNTQSFFNLSTTYLYDEVKNKKYVSSSETSDLQHIEKFSLKSQFGGITFNLLERLELFGLFGVSTGEIDWGDNPELNINSNAFKDGKTDKHFSWMTGARAIFLQWGCICLGAGVTYFDVPTLKTGSSIFETFLVPDDLGPQYFKIREWQGDIGLTAKFGYFMAYVTGQYLHSRLKIVSGATSTPTHYKNKSRLGIAVGTTLALTRKICFNIEWRQFSEDAISLEASFAF